MRRATLSAAGPVRRLERPAPPAGAWAAGSRVALILAVSWALLPAKAARAAEDARRGVAHPNPKLAFLLSAVLPGAGQFYLGERRAYLYLGADVSFWFAHFAYQDASRTREGEAESFARRHWSYDRYHDSRGTPPCSDLWKAHDDSLIVQLQTASPRRFYEVLAGSRSYRCGWDGLPADPNQMPANWSKYRDMRTQSTHLKNNARIALVAAVLNRMVSGVDAYRSARRRLDGAGGSTLRLESALEGSWQEPRAVLRLRKELP